MPLGDKTMQRVTVSATTLRSEKKSFFFVYLTLLKIELMFET